MSLPVGTKLLLHLNTSSLDSSAAPHASTDGAGVSFQSSVKQLGAGAAAFDGTANAWISFADSADWGLVDGDLLLEGFFRWSTRPSSSLQVLIGQWDEQAGGSKSFRLYLNHDGVNFSLKLQTSTNGTTLANTYESDVLTILANTFYHMRACRISGVLYFFLNGVAKGSMAMTDTLANATGTLFIGANINGATKNRNLNGYADEVLFVKGNGVSAAGFTPPASEYVDVTNVGKMSTRRRRRF